MKTKLFISLVITMFMAFTFVSCRKDSTSATNGLQFINLSAEKTTLQAGTTTKVTASVEMNCKCMCGTDYIWTTSAGTISGSGAEVILNAPSAAETVQITCSVGHCCNNQTLTKNINVAVQ